MKPVAQRHVGIVSSMIPPEHSGAGFAALKYSSRLGQRHSLAFLLTGTRCKTVSDNLGDDQIKRVLAERTIRVGLVNEERRSSFLREFLNQTIRCAGAFRVMQVRRHEYEIVHCFSPTWLSFFSAIAAKMLKKKIVLEITLQGGDCPESVSRNRFKILHHRRMLQFRMADAIVCISPALKAACLRAGFPAGKVHVIPRAVDIKKFRPADDERKAAIRRKLGLPSDIPLILFVGGIIRRKGIDLLLPAFRQLSAKMPEVALVIVGPAHKSADARSWHQAIMKMQEEPEIKGRLFYPGWKTNVDEYMQAADAFTLPSRSEGFGNVIIEAMACGLPPVCLTIPGITDWMIEHGENGYLSGGADAESLAATLEEAIEGVDRDPGIRRRAREKAVADYSPDRVDLMYERVYDEVLGIQAAVRPSAKSAPI